MGLNRIPIANDIEIFEGESGGSHAKKNYDIIALVDVLRATTTITTALENGASYVIPVRTIKQARTLAQQIDQVILGGERKGFPPKGFDLGNSPQEYTVERVNKRPIVLTTSNCTRVLDAIIHTDPIQDSDQPIIAVCLRNVFAAADFIRQLVKGSSNKSIAIVIAGKKGVSSPDDEIAAKLLYHRLKTETIPKDIRQTESILRTSPHGQSLIKSGLSADIQFCAQVDVSRIVPYFTERGFER